MGDIKPFGCRVAVVDPPAHEERYKGLIIPASVAMEQVSVGIVVHSEHGEMDHMIETFRSIGLNLETGGIKNGTLVYYIEGSGWPIKDVRIINVVDIIAFEELD